MKQELMQVDYLQPIRKNQVEPTYVKDFSEYGQIYQILCSPFEWIKDVMLLAFENKVLLVVLSFKVAM